MTDVRKRLFNLRHSGLRTEMTENIYAMWKRRWPITKHEREDLPTAKKTIVATAVLHNLCIRWADELPPLEDGEVDDMPAQEEDVADDGGDVIIPEYIIVVDNVPR